MVRLSPLLEQCQSQALACGAGLSYRQRNPAQALGDFRIMKNSRKAITVNSISMTSNHSSDLRFGKIPLNFGTGSIPALGFGTLIPDPAETRSATTNALRVGFRHFDCAERYRNEREVGESLQAEFATGPVAREDVFITTKLWNTNHRPERVEPAF